MEIVEISDKGIEGVEGRLVCVVVVEGPVFVQGPIGAVSSSGGCSSLFMGCLGRLLRVTNSCIASMAFTRNSSDPMT